MKWKRKVGRIIRASVLGFKEVELTHHAQEQMRIRNITEQHVIDTLSEPDEHVQQTQPGRTRVRRSISPYRYCDVVYLIKNRPVVVTVISIQKEKPKPLIRRKRRK